MTGLEIVETPRGEGRLHLDLAGRSAPTLLLGHGAGGGVDAADLAALAGSLPARGVSVIRFEQPWRLAGRTVAPPPPLLDEAWRAAVAHVRRRHGARPLLAGGRSAGARVACRTATALGVVAVVCCAFPLHPPGRSEKSRLDELLAPVVPVLVLQGTRDAFGSADALRAALGSAPPGSGQSGSGQSGSGPWGRGHRHVEVVDVPGADHGIRVAKKGPLDPAAVRALIVDAVAAFCASVT